MCVFARVGNLCHSSGQDQIYDGFDSVRRIVDSTDFGGVRLREALTLRFEGSIPTFLKRCGGDYAGEGNVPQSVVLCDATIVSADYLAVV